MTKLHKSLPVIILLGIMFLVPNYSSAYEFRVSPLVSVVSGEDFSSPATGLGLSAGYGKRIIPGIGYLIEAGYCQSSYESDSSFTHMWADLRLEWALLPSIKVLQPYIGASAGIYRYEQKTDGDIVIVQSTNEEKKDNCFGLGAVVGANTNLLPLIDLFVEIKAQRLFTKDIEKFGPADEDEWLITGGVGIRLALSLF